jgi:hypothetical protein
MAASGVAVLDEQPVAVGLVDVAAAVGLKHLDHYKGLPSRYLAPAYPAADVKR